MKACFFCQNNIDYIDYKNTDILQNFVNAQGKILAPKRTGLCARHQRELATAVKRARVIGLLKFANR
ncbi:MAG: 30S ribosomal protein S18 [Candidatus Portnoybacteria bacterium CG10_big_fil_rev_8_21_14_0_10_44_7]|uniref:Small ribosomal subunit protein bS18 n=1 Tax=Candidatus Portnoybacteria bacterium CG10_big_fil_rev_8_21_14_0_10_44_7 TaxID=1974816 RepID=A0A2M8KIE3_9BACT|nr:MAG: 30S ribosomal protein S18 [Candidatus Portnoybacteria bacterium CG10_big_fil_rev_8_21_14_0_10_44_7]